MPDGLYEHDILAWSEEQARLLGRLAQGEPGVNAAVDWPHVIEEVQDAAFDVVADRPDVGGGEPVGVVEYPFFVAFAGKDRAGIAAAHGDHDVGGFDGFCGEDLRGLARDVDALFGHGLDCDGVDLIAGHGSGGSDLNFAVGKFGEVAGGHLGAAGVVDAHEKDGGLAHLRSSDLRLNADGSSVTIDSIIVEAKHHVNHESREQGASVCSSG